MFKLIGDLKQLPKAAEDVLNDGDPLIVFAVNAKGETRAYRTSKAQCYGAMDLAQAPRDAASLIQRLNDELANQPSGTAVKTAPHVLRSEHGDIVEAALEGEPRLLLEMDWWLLRLGLRVKCFEGAVSGSFGAILPTIMLQYPLHQQRPPIREM
nr:hypothetical protein [Gammaproteobacteria bacterium]